MARKQFSVIYPDGSRKNVSGFCREQMLLRGEIKKTATLNVYRFVGPAESPMQTFHSFAELQELNLSKLNAREREILRRFYPGLFIFELGEEAHAERLESPQGLMVRLENPAPPRPSNVRLGMRDGQPVIEFV